VKIRRLATVQAHKMTARVTHLIDLKLRQKWSPEQISGWLRENESESISPESIYQYIWKDKKSGGQLYHY
jgi:IS30 family transposase